MATATLTSKGQVTLPRKIRDFLGLEKGDRIDFSTDENGRVYVTPLSKKTIDVFGMLARKGQRSRSLKETETSLAQALKKKFGRTGKQ